MNERLAHFAESIKKANHPEDIFGLISDGPLDQRKAALRSIYNSLAKVTHPDKWVGADETTRKAADVLFSLLSSFYRQAEAKLENGTYGKRSSVAATGYSPVKVGRYQCVAPFSEGDIADLHDCIFNHGGRDTTALFKIARDHRDNELLESEYKILRDLREKLQKKSKYSHQCVPDIFDSLMVQESKGGIKRRANVIEKFDGFFDCVQIHEVYPHGVDERTIVWMWKRLVRFIDWVHELGFIHGAVLPPHVMFFPDNSGTPIKGDMRVHAVRLIDWCYALKNPGSGSKLIAWCPDFEDFYPREVLDKKRIGVATDLYMAAKTMLYLVGGDVVSNTFPAHVDARVRDAFLECLHSDFARRPSNAGAYFDRFNALLQKVYGPPKFHHFNMPR